MSSKSSDEIDLTPADEAALDKAWKSITDEDIAASIAWLDQTTDDEKRPPVAE